MGESLESKTNIFSVLEPLEQNISTHEKVAQVLSLVQTAASTGELSSVRLKLFQFTEDVRAVLQPFFSTYQDPALDPGMAMLGYQVMEPLMQLLQVVDDLLDEKLAAGAALPQLQELAKQLVQADVALRAAELQTALLPCDNCGQDNERSALNCVQCGSALQDLPKDGDYVVVPDDYWILYNLCEQVASGDDVMDEWRTQVSGMAAEFAKGRRSVESADLNLGTDVDAKALLKALDDALDALQEMRVFEQDRNPEHLNQGWMRLLDAAKDVQDKGGEFYQSLTEFSNPTPD